MKAPKAGFSLRGHTACRRRVSRILFQTIIPLGDALPRRSSNLPASSGRTGYTVPHEGLSACGAPGRYAGCAGECACHSCLFGLAPCGVYHATFITERPVRSYRTISPLPVFRPAVSFLLHWPSLRLEAQIPDVIRHTALRSPDFPPPPEGGSDRPAACTAIISRAVVRHSVQTTRQHPKLRVYGALFASNATAFIHSILIARERCAEPFRKAYNTAMNFHRVAL